MSNNDKPLPPDGLQPIQELLPALKARKTVRTRLFDLPFGEDEPAIVYQHSVLCQTCMPYRDPGSYSPRLRRT